MYTRPPRIYVFVSRYAENRPIIHSIRYHYQHGINLSSFSGRLPQFTLPPLTASDPTVLHCPDRADDLHCSHRLPSWSSSCPDMLEPGNPRLSCCRHRQTTTLICTALNRSAAHLPAFPNRWSLPIHTRIKVNLSCTIEKTKGKVSFTVLGAFPKPF